jgi:hypothetical protein
MKIIRHGSRAHHGDRSIELRKIQCAWSANEKSIEIRCNDILDFTSNASHDYVVRIPLTDLSVIIATLGGQGTDRSSDDIAKAFEPSLKALIRLSAATAGLSVLSSDRPLRIAQ